MESISNKATHSIVGDVETYDDLIDHLATPMFMIDKEHTVIAWNKACEVLTGAKAVDMIGTKNQWTPFYDTQRVVLADLILDGKGNDMDGLYKKCEQQPMVEGGVCAEGWYPHLGGSGRYIFFNASLIKNAQGEIVGAVETLEDISEWRAELSKLRKAVEASGEAIFMTDREGLITFVNQEFTNLYGYAAAEVIGKTTPRILKSGTISSEGYKAFWERLLDKYAIEDEHINKTKDGRLLTIESSSNPILNEEGSIIGFLAIQRDITSRKEAEESLRQAKVKEDAILASIGDGMIATDRDGVIITMNHAAEVLLRGNREDFSGRKVHEIINTYDREGVLIPVEKRPINIALSTGKTTATAVATDAYFYERRDGTKFPAAIIVTPIMLNEEIIGAIDMFRDVTNERELEKQKDEFISLASHQLKNPITAISWNIEALIDGDKGPLTKEQQEVLGRIHESSENMAELVGGFLNITKMESAGFTVESGIVDLVQIADSVLGELISQITEKKIIVVKQYGENIPVLTIGTKTARIILQNILTNAIKYTPEGGTVEIKIERAGEEVSIIVKDNGYGIPEEAKGRIFTKLFRADNVKEKEPLGTGLGLYLVKSLVDRLCGKIWFESKEGVGTTFYINLK